MKYNLKGELFGTYLGERIMKFTDKWRIDQNNLVYDPESILYNYFPFDDENNYAITGGQLLGKGFRIVKFSSTKPESKILFETKSNRKYIIKINRQAIALNHYCPHLINMQHLEKLKLKYHLTNRKQR